MSVASIGAIRRIFDILNIAPLPFTRQLTHQLKIASIRCSIVVSIPACHAGDPGSIPGGGDFSVRLKIIMTDDHDDESHADNADDVDDDDDNYDGMMTMSMMMMIMMMMMMLMMLNENDVDDDDDDNVLDDDNDDDDDE